MYRKHLITYIFIYIFICCGFVGLNKDPYKMHGTYIKIKKGKDGLKCGKKNSRRCF